MFGCCSGPPTEAAAPSRPSAGGLSSSTTEAGSDRVVAPAGVPASYLRILAGFDQRSYRDDFVLAGQELGQGAFGDVVLAYAKDGGAKRAIKLVELQKLENEKEAEALKQECELLLKCGSHVNVCQLFAVYLSGGELAMEMELVGGGDLFDGICNAPDECLTEAFAAAVIERTCCALDYLHKTMNIAHRDIKPENIMLLGEGGVASQDLMGPLCKLTDFGFATFCVGEPDDLPGQTLSTTCGSPEYVAPECIGTQRKYGYQCDVWSAGVTIYTCLCGYPPFYEPESHVKLFKMIQKGAFDFPEEEWGQISPEAQQLIRRMILLDPAERISAAEVRNHPWIMANVHQNDLNGIASPATRPTLTPLGGGIQNKLLQFSKMTASRKFRTAGKVAI
eukprot:COSAG05_NODE_4238_length_1609_cov_7.744731_2_plen_391_part_01